MTVYKSKAGPELLLPVFTILTAVLLIMIYSGAWVGIVIVSAVLIFVTHIFLFTNYTIDGQRLMIRCGFLYRKSIDIPTILKIRETRNPISAPATSLDRLELKQPSGSVIISPLKKSAFIQHLQTINPDIQYSKLEVRGRKSGGRG